MSHLHRVLCGVALAALIPISACSSSGRVGFAGDLGGSPSGPSQPADPNPDPSQGGGDPALADAVNDGADTVLAAAGNLTGNLLPNGGGDVGEGADALGRVTVGDETIVGEQGSRAPTAIGLSVNSETQEQGELATLGVLNNGQVIAANEVGNAGGGDLIGARVDGDQVIGEGGQQQVGLGVLSSSDERGEIADVNLLTGNQIIDVELNNSANGEGAGSLTDGLQGLLGQD
jgi:hypothetical protein